MVMAVERTQVKCSMAHCGNARPRKDCAVTQDTDLARVQATAFKRYLSFRVAGENLAKELLHESCAMQLSLELKRRDAKKKPMLNLNEIKITPRDEQVLRLLVQGCSNKEIASQLKISPRTVKQHLRTLFLRAGIRDGRKRVKLATAMFQREQVELCNRKTA